MPSRALGSHLETTPIPPPDSRLWRENTGQPDELFYLSFGETVMLDKLSNGEEASSLFVRIFLW